MTHFSAPTIVSSTAVAGVLVGLIVHACLDSLEVKVPMPAVLLPAAIAGAASGAIAVGMRDVDQIVLVDVKTRQQKRVEEITEEIRFQVQGLSEPEFVETPMGVFINPASQPKEEVVDEDFWEEPAAAGAEYKQEVDLLSGLVKEKQSGGSKIPSPFSGL